jgi:hypothetical protein
MRTNEASAKPPIWNAARRKPPMIAILNETIKHILIPILFNSKPDTKYDVFSERALAVVLT